MFTSIKVLEGLLHESPEGCFDLRFTSFGCSRIFDFDLYLLDFFLRMILVSCRAANASLGIKMGYFTMYISLSTIVILQVNIFAD